MNTIQEEKIEEPIVATDIPMESHIVTEEDLEINPELREHGINVGEEIGIVDPEVIDNGLNPDLLPIEEKVIEENYRECTCGTLVPLPDGSAEEFSICEGCGIKHIR